MFKEPVRQRRSVKAVEKCDLESPVEANLAATTFVCGGSFASAQDVSASRVSISSSGLIGGDGHENGGLGNVYVSNLMDDATRKSIVGILGRGPFEHSHNLGLG